MVKNATADTVSVGCVRDGLISESVKGMID